MRYSTFIAPIVLLAIPVTAAASECRPSFVDDGQAVVIDGVEIEPGGRAAEGFQVRVQNAAAPAGGPPPTPAPPGGSVGLDDGGPCEATIRVARVGAPPASGFPPYLLRAAGNQRIEVLPDPASGGTADSDVVIANAPPGPQGRVVPFQIGVSTEWGLRAGTYVEQLELLLIDRNGEVTDRSSLTISIVIPSAVSLRLVGAVVGDGRSGPAQVDLGNLSSTSETRSDRFGARIFSTAPYVVSFSSANQGNLLHDQGSEQIPYRLFFDGNQVNLAGISEFPYLDSTPQGGDNRPMSIVVPPVVALAGRYSDRITMTVTAM
jgi:hypothetical protein